MPRYAYEITATNLITQADTVVESGFLDASSALEADATLDNKAGEMRLDADSVAYYHFDEVPA